MATLIGGRANVAISTVDKTFAELGFNSGNIEIVYEVGGPALKSWMPGRAINAITSVTSGRGYYIIPKTNIVTNDFQTTSATIPTYSGTVITFS